MPAHPNFFLREMNVLAHDEGFKFESTPKAFSPLNEWDDAFCEIDGVDGGLFHAQQMPGCCAVLVVSHVYPKKMTQENFLKILERVEKAAKKAGFGSLLMAQTGQPENWEFLMNKGWDIDAPFVNAKSGNHVMYISKNLEQPGKVKGLEF